MAYALSLLIISWVILCWLRRLSEPWTSCLKSGAKFIDKIYSVGEYSKSFTDKYLDPKKSDILLYGIEQLEQEINKK